LNLLLLEIASVALLLLFFRERCAKELHIVTFGKPPMKCCEVLDIFAALDCVLEIFRADGRPLTNLSCTPFHLDLFFPA